MYELPALPGDQPVVGIDLLARVEKLEKQVAGLISCGDKLVQAINGQNNHAQQTAVNLSNGAQQHYMTSTGISAANNYYRPVFKI